MNIKQVNKILKDTSFVHTGGSDKELEVANYLMDICQSFGVDTHLESFSVPMADINDAHLYADGKEIECRGYKCCGSGTVEAPLYYMPNTDKASLVGVKGKIVLLDVGASHFLYQDLVDNGAVGFITYDGNVHYADRDIDQKELRSYVSMGKYILGANINAKDAVKLIKADTKTVKITIAQNEYEGKSHNVVAEIPGNYDEYIVLTAHYDTVALSVGSYDNMTGCIGLLTIMEELKKLAPLNYGVRFVFCGSEERGLLGSKAYVAAHEEEISKFALNINLDMIGTYMGKFISCVSAEEALVSYLKYICMQAGWGINVNMGVYSSDSTPFADKGVPALSFARIAPASQATIHNRYDTAAVISPRQLIADSLFITGFALRMADAVKCPVSRNIPEKVTKELDEYLNRKRRDQ